MKRKINLYKQKKGTQQQNRSKIIKPLTEIKRKMQKSTYTDESQAVQQLSKPEIQLTAQELANVEVVQKTIKRYQNKITEMLKIIQRQRKQNETLKVELKQLNQNLNVMIEKINIKNQKKQQPQKQDVVKKSLENEIKKSVAMKKQLQVLRAKVKIFEAQKITDLQDEIRQKDKVIEQQNNTIKMYTKLEKQESNVDIYKKYNEANEKINSLNGQLVHLKKKLNEVKKVQDQQEKSIKRQHEKIISLEKKQTQDKGRTQGFTKKQDKLENASSSQIIKLKEKFQSLQNAKKMSQKAFRVQIQTLKTRNKLCQKELDEYKSQMNRKDKQANILMSRMKQMTRKSHQTLQPVQKVIHKGDDMLTSGLFDHRKEYKGLMHLQNNSTGFDDTEALPLERSYRIKCIKFVWFEEHILSLATTYELADHSVKEIVSFSIPHQYKNIKEEVLNFSDFEYVNEMEIFCSKFIQFIRIKTSRNQLLEVGSEKNTTKCKKFTYDIKTNEKPIAFMGAIQSKKIGGNEMNGNNKEHLISVGIEIKKKNVFTKNRFHPSSGMRSESLMKKMDLVQSRLGMTKEVQNDKNIKHYQEEQK